MLRGGSFSDDVEMGLTSEAFDLQGNISQGDARKGLDALAKTKILAIMRSQNIAFDQARLQYLRSEMSSNNIGPDGRPRDPKFVSFDS
jgi:hypothetical protein